MLFGHAGEVFYLRQIARLSGLAVGSIQRELKRLTEAGIITRSVQGRQVYYRANEACPVFGELKSILIKTAGVADVLRAALAPLADRIRVAFMFGSMTTGREKRDSDVDVMVVGDASFADVVKALGVAQNTLHREINPTVYPPDEFKAKVAEGQHFVTEVLKGEKIYLVGDEHEIERIVG